MQLIEMTPSMRTLLTAVDYLAVKHDIPLTDERVEVCLRTAAEAINVELPEKLSLIVLGLPEHADELETFRMSLFCVFTVLFDWPFGAFAELHDVFMSSQDAEDVAALNETARVMQAKVKKGMYG